MRIILTTILLLVFISNLWAQQPVGLYYNLQKSMEVGYFNSISLLQLSDEIPIANDPFYYTLIQIPIESYLDLARHEYFGHGYRAREYRIEKSYKLPFNWPLSMEGFFYATGIPSKGDESFLLTTSGMESGTYYAYKYQKYFLTDPDFGKKHFFYYLFSKGDLLFYADKTYSEYMGSQKVDPDSDVSGYYANLQAKYNWKQNAWDDYQDTYRLTRQAMFGFYDLTLMGFACFLDNAGRFLNGDRKITLDFPRWEVFGQRFLPGTRVGLTPWGVEYYLDFYLLQENNSVNTFYIRQSDQYLENFWGGGFELDKISWSDQFSYGFGLDIFSQPLVNDPATIYNYYPKPESNKYGYNVFIVPEWTFHSDKQLNASVMAKLAYKTDGFVMGQPLAKGSYGFMGFLFEF